MSISGGVVPPLPRPAVAWPRPSPTTSGVAPPLPRLAAAHPLPRRLRLLPRPSPTGGVPIDYGGAPPLSTTTATTPAHAKAAVLLPLRRPRRTPHHHRSWIHLPPSAMAAHLVAVAPPSPAVAAPPSSSTGPWRRRTSRPVPVRMVTNASPRVVEGPRRQLSRPHANGYPLQRHVTPGRRRPWLRLILYTIAPKRLRVLASVDDSPTHGDASIPHPWRCLPYPVRLWCLPSPSLLACWLFSGGKHLLLGGPHPWRNGGAPTEGAGRTRQLEALGSARALPCAG